MPKPTKEEEKEFFGYTLYLDSLLVQKLESIAGKLERKPSWIVRRLLDHIDEGVWLRLEELGSKESPPGKLANGILIEKLGLQGKEGEGPET